MKIAFKLKEFIITKAKTISLEIADKLYHYHIIPMIIVRNKLGVPIWASDFSGYRPKWYELKKKRSGKSQHVFNGKGAVDWTCKDFSKNKEKFLKLIIKHTNYTRIAIYETFIHCDYKQTDSGKRELYKSNSSSKWEFIKYAA